MSAVRASKVFVIAAGLLTILVTAQLGRWQLSRAAQKTALEQAMQAHADMPLLDGAVLAGDLTPQRRAELLFRHVSLRGRWLPGETVFLDNRVMQRRAGFYVLTPLQLAHQRRAVVVVRGWGPRDAYDPARLPDFETPAGTVEVTGRIIAHAPQMFALSEQAQGPIRQNLELDEYAAETGLALAPVLVQQLGPASDGLQRNWAPPALDVERNYGYAVQWFGMSLVVAFLLIWFQGIKPRLRTREQR
ncbi:MAG: SURF1 family protein [Ottowia sp.]|nr:SURF1 family protein [Ottowia sp.]